MPTSDPTGTDDPVEDPSDPDGTPGDFTLGLELVRIDVHQGSRAVDTVLVTVSGGVVAVNLAASGAAGLAFAFSTTFTATTSVLTVTVPGWFALGDTTVTVTGTGGGHTHTATVILTVLPGNLRRPAVWF